MEKITIEQRLQKIESLLKSQKNALLNKKEKSKKIGKIVIIVIEKMIQMLLPYIVPFIIHFWDIIYNLLQIKWLI